MPQDGDDFTEDEAYQIVNWDEVAQGADVPWEITNGWHQGPDGGGVFDPRAMGWGYQDGFPLYAGVSINGQKHHVYWIANTGEIWLDPNLPG